MKVRPENVGARLAKKVKSLGEEKRCLIDITPTTKTASQFVLARCSIHDLTNLYEFHLYKCLEKGQSSIALLRPSLGYVLYPANGFRFHGTIRVDGTIAILNQTYPLRQVGAK